MSLRVLHIASDDVTGGAARCAFRLHRGLRELGHDSHMLVGRKRSHDPTVTRFELPASPLVRLDTRLRRAWIDQAYAPYRSVPSSERERFSDDRSATGRAFSRSLPPSDVVHLHWVAGLVDYRAFLRSIAVERPVIWTLHDMNPFTGGCHYDAGCGAFRARCGACPQLGSIDPNDLSRRIWNRKRKVFERLDPSRLHLVTPSRWLAEEVASSSIFGSRFPISVVPYGVDTEAFAPRDRIAARKTLGIPALARVVLFVAYSTELVRKGFSMLVSALGSMTDVPDLFLLSIGQGSPSNLPSVPHTHLRYTDEDRLLSLVYSAADVFVAPSSQDNLPATVLEALACGVPVVATGVGGVPEAVRPGVNGALVEPDDAAGLAAAIRTIIGDDDVRRQLGAGARRIALDEYALDIQARRYLEIYTALVDSAGTRPPRVHSVTRARSGAAV